MWTSQPFDDYQPPQLVFLLDDEDQDDTEPLQRRGRRPESPKRNDD